MLDSLSGEIQPTKQQRLSIQLAQPIKIPVECSTKNYETIPET